MDAAVTLPNTGLVRLPTVLAVFPVSRSTWWAGVKAQKYPQPVYIGENTTAWRAEDIKRLIDSQATAKPKPSRRRGRESAQMAT